MRFPAGIIRATPVVPTISAAPGVWKLREALQARGQSIWPGQRPTTWSFITTGLAGGGLYSGSVATQAALSDGANNSLGTCACAAIQGNSGLVLDMGALFHVLSVSLMGNNDGTFTQNVLNGSNVLAWSLDNSSYTTIASNIALNISTPTVTPVGVACRYIRLSRGSGQFAIGDFYVT